MTVEEARRIEADCRRFQDQVSTNLHCIRSDWEYDSIVDNAFPAGSECTKV